MILVTAHGSKQWGILCCFFVLCFGIGTAADPAVQPTPSPAAAPTATTNGVPSGIEDASQLPDGPERTKTLATFVPALKDWAQKDPIAALTWLQKVKTPTVSPWSTVLFTCGQTQGKESAEWSLQTTGHPFIHPILFSWASVDPPTAAAWCLQAQKPEDIRYLMFFSIGDGAAYKDPVFASAWTDKLESEPDRLASIRGVMLRWPSKDAQAATLWIKQQKGEALRVAATAFLEYNGAKFKTAEGAKDVPAMKTWLDQFPLSDADKESALKGMGFTPYAGPPKK
jgi:hypothetical protein